MSLFFILQSCLIIKLLIINSILFEGKVVSDLYITNLRQRKRISVSNDILKTIWKYFQNLSYPEHSCLASPLAPDPIRVQSYVCWLFWTNRNSMAVTCIFLSISLSNYRAMKPSISAISKWFFTSTETIV